MKKLKLVRPLKIMVHAMNYVPVKTEILSQEVLTVPDMTLTVQELLQYHTRNGQFPDGMKKARIYDETQVYPNPKALDFVDIQEKRHDLTLKQEMLTKKIEDERSKKNNAEQKSKATEKGTEPTGSEDSESN